MGALTIMLYYSWRLTSVMLSVVPVVVIGAGVYQTDIDNSLGIFRLTLVQNVGEFVFLWGI
jgi:hypothetical protein